MTAPHPPPRMESPRDTEVETSFRWVKDVTTGREVKILEPPRPPNGSYRNYVADVLVSDLDGSNVRTVTTRDLRWIPGGL